MRGLVLLLAGLLLALTLVGCAGGGDEAATTTTSSETITETATEVSKPPFQAQGRWVITDLGTLGGDWSEAVAINNRGQITGDGWTGAKDKFGDFIEHAFLWEQGKMIDLGSLPLAKHSAATAINASGQIVGYAYESYNWHDQREQGTRAVLWLGERMIDVGGRESWAVAINDLGQVVAGQPGSVWEHGKRTPLGLDAAAINDRGQIVGENGGAAILWEKGTATDLGSLGDPLSDRREACAINERGQIVGDSETESGYDHAFLWQNGSMTDLGTLGGTWSEACSHPEPLSYTWPDAINERGQIVGSSDIGAKKDEESFVSHAFLWQDGEMTDLGALSGDSGAVAINERGQIVGWSWTKAGDTHAVAWENGRIIDLGTLGGKESQAFAINNRGLIVGRSETKSGDWHAVLWTLKRG